MSTIKHRAFNALNLEQYFDYNHPDKVGRVTLDMPNEEVNILRMLIKKPFENYKLPNELNWINPLLDRAIVYQSEIIGVNHPFCYLTIRRGAVKSVTDDEWHVDGFSQTITHLPEQNYLWTDKTPTEYLDGLPIAIPEDFDSSLHNIHNFFQNHIKECGDSITPETFEPETIYCVDPYIIHRRPPASNGMLDRTFIRISFTPIEINDISNTLNPLIPTSYSRNGVKDMRDKLIEYLK